MRKMIAKHNFPYGMHEVKSGEPFDAEDGDVEMLEHVGFATAQKNVKTAAKPQTYQTRVLTAANESKADPVVQSRDPKPEGA